jgi:hypothetical protein
MIMNLFTFIINSVVVNAVLGLVVNEILVVLLSVLLLGLVLMVSVNSIIWFVKNSILSKAMIRIRSKMKFLKEFEADMNRQNSLA